MKLQDPKELLLGLGVILDDNYGRFNNRPIRYIEHTGALDVGEDVSEFDRWANSLEMSFDLLTPKGQRAFIKWVEEDSGEFIECVGKDNKRHICAPHKNVTKCGVRVRSKKLKKHDYKLYSCYECTY